MWFISIGATATASTRRGLEKILEANQGHDFTCMNFCAQLQKPAILADFFSSICCTAQHGNFQRLLFDLTRLSVRLDIHSGSTFIKSAAHLTQDFFNSQQLSPSAVRAVCPDLNLSFQQQVPMEMYSLNRDLIVIIVFLSIFMTVLCADTSKLNRLLDLSVFDLIPGLHLTWGTMVVMVLGLMTRLLH